VHEAPDVRGGRPMIALAAPAMRECDARVQEDTVLLGKE
jgi:hypothetical protein